MKVGEIYLNKHASEENPCRVFIITSIGKKLVYAKCEQNGKLDRVYFPISHIQNDTEHFIKIGYLNYDEIIAKNLAGLKRFLGAETSTVTAESAIAAFHKAAHEFAGASPDDFLALGIGETMNL